MLHVPQGITRGFGRAVLQSKKQSPHIFFGAGLIGIVGSTVLACKQTLKLEDEIEGITHDLIQVKGMAEVAKRQDTDYDEADYYKDLSYIYVKSAGRIVKLYWFPATLGGISIILLAGSHYQMTKRNAALTTTLAALSKAFDEYRLRVQEKIGKEEELILYRGAQARFEDEMLSMLDPDGPALFDREFDETNVNWKNSGEFNRMFIECAQNHANELLKARGHVFLNDVYDALGFDRTSEGSVFGWVYDKDHPDAHIDFGLYLTENSDYLFGAGSVIYLHFNVHDVIFNKI